MDLEPEELRRIARGHYREGRGRQALGCARLAHAVRRYYRELDVDDELRSLLDALYYLRRTFVMDQSVSYRLLRYMLWRDLLPRLEVRPLLSASVVFMLIEEMGACLNELGAYQRASDVLAICQERISSRKDAVVHSRLASSVFRQFAFCMICCGKEEGLIGYAMEQAQDRDDASQNVIGIANARALLCLARGDPKGALCGVESLIEEVERRIVSSAHPEIIGCSRENYLALHSGMLFAHAQLRTPSLPDMLEEFKAREDKCCAQLRLSWPADLWRIMLEATESMPSLKAFLSRRATIPMKENLADVCADIVRLLM